MLAARHHIRERRMGDFLAFRKFITPVFIAIIFWVGVAGIVILGLLNFVQYVTVGTASFVMIGVAWLFLGIPILVVIWRVFCEVAVVFFRILDRLDSIDRKAR
jgi:hypothetical protein